MNRHDMVVIPYGAIAKLRRAYDCDATAIARAAGLHPSTVRRALERYENYRAHPHAPGQHRMTGPVADALTRLAMSSTTCPRPVNRAPTIISPRHAERMELWLADPGKPHPVGTELDDLVVRDFISMECLEITSDGKSVHLTDYCKSLMPAVLKEYRSRHPARPPEPEPEPEPESARFHQELLNALGWTSGSIQGAIRTVRLMREREDKDRAAASKPTAASPRAHKVRINGVSIVGTAPDIAAIVKAMECV